MNEQQTRIWECLTTDHLGKENAILIRDLADKLGILPYGTNNDDVRANIRDMVLINGKQIGTSDNGCFIITNDEEKEQAAQYLERNSRAAAVRRNGVFTRP